MFYYVSILKEESAMYLLLLENTAGSRYRWVKLIPAWRLVVRQKAGEVDDCAVLQASREDPASIPCRHYDAETGEHTFIIE